MHKLTEMEKRNWYAMRSIIGRNIYMRRLQKGWTLKRLSGVTGIHMQAIDKYELGRGRLHLITLMKMSAALELPVEQLFVAQDWYVYP